MVSSPQKGPRTAREQSTEVTWSRADRGAAPGLQQSRGVGAQGSFSPGDGRSCGLSRAEDKENTEMRVGFCFLGVFFW